MAKDEKTNNPVNTSNDVATDLQSAVDSLTSDTQPVSAISPTSPPEITKEPFSSTDQKIKSGWSESLPQTDLSDSINIEKEQVKLDQPTNQEKAELRTTPLANISKSPQEEIPLVADIVPGTVTSKSNSVVTPETQSVGNPSFSIPKATPSPRPLPPSYSIVNFKVIVLVLLLLITAAGVLVYFKKLPFNLNLPTRQKESNVSTTPTPTPIQPSVTVKPEAKEELPHRKLSWLVPVAPSTTPVDLTNNWPVFKSGTITMKYPKEWQLLDSTTQPTGVILNAAKSLNPAVNDPLTKSPIEILLIQSPTDSAILINNIIGQKASEVVKTQVAIANFQATKTSNETGPDGQQTQRLFVPVANQVVVITLRPQAQEDQVIFEMIANSIKVG